MKDKLAFALLAVSTAATSILIPSWRGFATDPCLWAFAGACVTVAVLLVTRHLGDRARLFEVKWVALFLAAMPFIYVGRWLLKEGATAGDGWLVAELAGVVVYVSLAVLGLKRHWLLAVGIAAHGIGWDIWHYYPRSAYIPAWYAVGCLVVDITLALYVAARIPAWRRAEERVGGAAAARTTEQAASPITAN